MFNFLNKIKVDKSVKPIRYAQRTPVQLVVGNDYYVSFGSHEAYKCKLVDVSMLKERNQIRIEIPSKTGVSPHILFPDEIGMTPEEAVMNEVTM
jgi:hypothetical protein